MMIALYPEEKRGYAVGLFTFIFAMGGLLGPIAGGFSRAFWLASRFLV